MSRSPSSDIAQAKVRLASLPGHWDGRQAILAMKEAGFSQWKQMEWFGFYFEFLAHHYLEGAFDFPGDRYGSTTFDMKGSINWDLKAKAVNSKSRDMYLNDLTATDLTIAMHGYYGLVIALCDVEYNDADRSFYEWHAHLKGEKSAYEIERETRSAPSRDRKMAANVREIVFVLIDSTNISILKPKRQGRNSNQKDRPLKYGLTINRAQPAIVDRLVFP